MISKRSPEVRPRPVRSSVAENDELTLKPLGSSHAVQASDPNAGPTASPEAAHLPIASSMGGLPPAPSAPCAVGESRPVGSGMEDALATNSPFGTIAVTFDDGSSERSRDTLNASASVRLRRSWMSTANEK